MKEKRNLHLKVQELCDCYATTDPLNPDSDADMYADGLEVARGSNPKNASNVPSFENSVAIVDVAAAGLPLGPLAGWDNQGALQGRFKSSTPPPVVETVGGVKAVTFDGSGYAAGPVAPNWMNGNSARTVEAWVYNPELADEETVFSWGRRGGPDGSNCSFNHGGNATFGAVGHWGVTDVGWNGQIVASQWNHIAYTWDPTTTEAIVYSNGQSANTNIIGAGLVTWDVNDVVDSEPVPLTFVLAAQHDANGAITETLRGALSIARLRVYDQALGAEAIAQIYDTEAPQYTAITIQSVTYQPATDSVTMTWNVAAGRTYEVLATTLHGDWTSVASGLAAGTYTEQPASAHLRRFYRIRLE